MYRLRVVDSKTVLDEGLLEIIVEFDKENMADFHGTENAPLDEEIRSRNFTHNEIFILAFTVDDRLAGYLEYGPCPKNGEEIFITSMQIDRRYRQSILISQILLQAKRDLLRRSFTKLTCKVDNENLAVMSLSAKLGFSACENSNENLHTVSAGPEALENKLLNRMERRTQRQEKACKKNGNSKRDSADK